jgi:hypothetical protein
MFALLHDLHRIVFLHTSKCSVHVAARVTVGFGAQLRAQRANGHSLPTNGWDPAAAQTTVEVRHI